MQGAAASSEVCTNSKTKTPLAGRFHHLAERVGFEPTYTREDVTGIPVQRLRPLGHLSAGGAESLHVRLAREKGRPTQPASTPAARMAASTSTRLPGVNGTSGRRMVSPINPRR